LLEIANQLKNAAPIVKEDEREVYIDLNVRAGKAVYGMSDFDMAFDFYYTARGLLPSDTTVVSSETTKEIYLKLVELQYNRKNYDECIDLVDTMYPYFMTNLPRAKLLRTKAKALYGLGSTDKAISTGLDALRLVGIEMEEDDAWNVENYKKLRPRIPVSVSEIRDLVNVKQALDPHYLLAQEIISIITIPLYLSPRRHLFRSLVFTAIATFIDHGSSASCAFSLLSLANLFQKDGGNANLMIAYEYSKLAIVISEVDTAVGMDFGINIYEYYALTLAIYFEPLSEVIR
jgi:osomolarity two-component system sensor histidine kinase CHK1